MAIFADRSSRVQHLNVVADTKIDLGVAIGQPVIFRFASLTG